MAAGSYIPASLEAGGVHATEPKTNKILICDINNIAN